MKKLEKKIKYSGINYDINIFMFIRILFSILVLIIGVILFKPGFIIGPIVAIIFYYLMEYILIDCKISKRCRKLERDALDYIPALLLNLKNGKSIKVSIKNSSKVIDGELSSLFNQVLDSVKVGLTIEEGLNNIIGVIPSIYIQNIIIDIKENIKSGTNVTDSIYLQLGSLEEHYNNMVIGYKKMIPIKMCLVSILGISIMVLILVIKMMGV